MCLFSHIHAHLSVFVFVFQLPWHHKEVQGVARGVKQVTYRSMKWVDRGAFFQSTTVFTVHA
jgi:hypothetical protein